ncbi:MAG TPA: hypothetical protein VIL44_05800 [Micromonospora sp.]|jgi:hypothetical protein
MADYRPYDGRHYAVRRPRRGGSRAREDTVPRSGRPSRRGVPRTALILALVPVLALAGTVAWDHLTTGQPEWGATAPTAATSRPGEASPAATTDTIPADVRFVEVGECLRNDGHATSPRFTIAPCGPRTYEVLARFDGPTDGEADAKAKCRRVPGYTDWYYFKTELSALDYVLCLRWR